MLAKFFLILLRFKLFIIVCTIFLFLPQFLISQNASILENLTENDGLPSNYIFNVAEDHNNCLWIATDKGLEYFQDGKWYSINTDTGLPGNYINNVIADGKNGLLIAISEKGLYYFNTNNKHIETIFSQKNHVTLQQFLIPNKDSNYIIIKLLDKFNNKIFYFAFDKNNRKNLKKITEKKIHQKKYFLINESGKEKIIADEDILLEKNIVVDSLEIEKTSFGIIRKSQSKVIDTISEKNGLGNNWINNIYKRKNGDVYISTLGGGLSILKNQNYKISYPVNSTNVRDIIDFNQKVYILADGFLYIVSKKKIEKKIFVGKDAQTMYLENNLLYIGNFSGLHIYSLKNNQLQLIKSYPLTAGISKIIKNNNKIIFSTYGLGLYVVEKNSLINFKNKPFNNIENLYKIKNGFAVTSYEDGLTILDEHLNYKAHFNKKNRLLSNFVTSVFSDNDTIFVGTKNGVTALLDNVSVIKYNESKGFIGNITRNIFRDNKKSIWFVTDKTILRNSKQQLKPFGFLNLLNQKDNIILKGKYFNSNNSLVVVTKNNFCSIDLAKVLHNKEIPDIILEKILIDGVPTEQSNIALGDHNKGIQFIFESVDKDYFNGSQLYYKVNRDEWKLFREPRVLKFSHLDKGEYSLNIKVVNKDGYEKIISSPIKFKVLGPVYLRGWFLVLFFGFLSYFLYNYINENNKKKYIKRLNELRVKQQIEGERKRISRDLHDNIGAYVTSLISKIDLLKISTPEIQDNSNVSCDDVRLDAEHILALLRQTIWVLANKDTNLIAFYDNFKSYARKFLKTENVKVIFEENIEQNRTIDATTGSAIFRIMQEALQNIHKHAEATKVEINITSKQKIAIYIKDNGKGFKSKESLEGFGIRNMQERAKEHGFKFNIYSDFSGTTIELYEI